MLLSANAEPSPPVAAAITRASRATGTSFDFLLKTAERESKFDPGAKAATSSAAGLFQFIESTWLAMVKEEGSKYGLGGLASQIEKTATGYRVSDPTARRQILDLRYDASASAMLAGELAQKNRESLKQALGREPSQGELYAAHLLGASEAVRLVTLAAKTPDAAAAAAFPSQAAANRGVFYDGSGRALSLRDVSARLTTAQVAQASRAGPAALQVPPAAQDASPGAETATGPFAWHPRGNTPVFHDLFTSFAGRPVAQYVQAVSAWPAASGSPAASARPAASAFAEPAASRTPPAVSERDAATEAGRIPIRRPVYLQPPASTANAPARDR